MKNLFLSCSILAIGLSLAGCELSKQPVTCDQMKRQWLYNTTNLNTEAAWTTGSQHQDLQSQMQANDCD